MRLRLFYVCVFVCVFFFSFSLSLSATRQIDDFSLSRRGAPRKKKGNEKRHFDGHLNVRFTLRIG